MSKMRRTIFNNEWLLMPKFAGVIKGKVETEAFCSICNKTLQLSNMGIEKSREARVKACEKSIIKRKK